jgi:4-phospho-D-threonate 3-dehydrogenase / 4-phospho-D-erythronate 3-dehydrogenase
MPPKRIDSKPEIAITMGDPRGIGPEVVVKALAKTFVQEVCNPWVIGNSRILAQTADLLGLGLKFVNVEDPSQKISAGAFPVLAVPAFSSPEAAGPISKVEGGRVSFAYVAKAGEMALKGEVQALVTGPVSKEAIAEAGIPFRGHTEYLAEISQTRNFVMMLAGEKLRVALVTTHLPLRDVPGALEEEKIFSVIRITCRGLRDFFGFSVPRVAVTALNPHAGEGGLFGEEEKMISRAIARGREQRLEVSGPWPADSLFHRALKGEFEAVVCMYHDQGLIPLKMIHFDSAVNITLGLPFIRTSVDHGVAYDIAGKGRASSRSMEEAIRMAVEMVKKRNTKFETSIRVQNSNDQTKRQW